MGVKIAVSEFRRGNAAVVFIEFHKKGWRYQKNRKRKWTPLYGIIIKNFTSISKTAISDAASESL